MASTCRPTAAQATIRFLKNQYLARDGIEHQFFSGCLEFSATENKPLASLCFSRSRAGVHSSIRRSRKAAGQCLFVRLAAFIRSEERRVGKGCRSSVLEGEACGEDG